MTEPGLTEPGLTEPGAAASTADLLGRWTVIADGTAADTVLVLEPGSFTLGSAFGAWRAGGGLFVAQVQSAEGGTDGAPADLSTPTWLATAEQAQAVGDEVLLRDAGGVVTARLSPAADPATPTVPPNPLDPPAEAAALAPGLVPAHRQALLGRWVVAGGGPAVAGPAPSVEFAPDGSYTGSDGCNAAGGRWASGAAGLILATDSPMTLMACPGTVPVPSWLAGASRAGFDGDELVLLDPLGTELGRLVRA